MINCNKDCRILNSLDAAKYTITGKRGTIVFTRREVTCIIYLFRGETAKEMARRMYVSHRTVESHLLKIRKKIGCFSRSQLISYIFDSDFLQQVGKVVSESEVENYIFMAKLG